MSTRGKTKDGGPAFPRTGNAYAPDCTGMTLRDWFAGQAMAGMYAAAAANGGISTDDRSLSCDAATFYRLADAMLKERDNRKVLIKQAPAHAALPLKVGGDHDHLVYCDNDLGTLVARCGGKGFDLTGWTKEQCAEMAAFLAHAANCHDELLTALRVIRGRAAETAQTNATREIIRWCTQALGKAECRP